MFRFRVKPVYADFVALNRIAGVKQSPTPMVISVLAALVFVVQPFALRGLGHEVSAWRTYRDSLPILILSGVAAFLFFATKSAVRRRWNAAEEIRSEQEYEISQEGIRVRGDSFESYLEWKYFNQVLHREGYIAMKTAQNQYYYFPEAAVPDHQALLEFVRSRVTETKKPFEWLKRKSWMIWASVFGAVLVYLLSTN